MSQNSQPRDHAIGWKGDSPKPDAVVKKTLLPIGFINKTNVLSTKRDRNTGSPSSTGLRRYATDCVISQPTVNRSPPSQDNKLPSDSPLSRFPMMVKPDIEQRFKSLIMDKKPVETPTDEPMLSSGETSSFCLGNLPNTSTPTTTAVPLPRTDRSQIPCSSRRKFPAKRHRLVESLESPKAKQPATREDQNDDNSWMAGLDLEALIKDAKQKKGGVIGNSFKRFKTTGDLSDAEIEKTQKQAAVNRPQVRTVEDDDDYFQNPNFLADVDKVERIGLSQRCNR